MGVPKMNINIIKERLDEMSVFFSSDSIKSKPTVIGYDKKFRWRWMATQLNTFIIASDFGNETISVQTIEEFLTDSFRYAKDNYRGWPRGLQSGLGVIVILISEKVDQEAIEYCKKLKSGKKWAGFAIPVTIDASSKQVYFFDHKPMWGRIYYPYFNKMINQITK